MEAHGDEWWYVDVTKETRSSRSTFWCQEKVAGKSVAAPDFWPDLGF